MISVRILQNDFRTFAEILCVVVYLSSSLGAVDDVDLDTDEVDNIPYRTSDDLYLDPCKAAGFWGDIALTDEEYRSTKKMLLKQMASSNDVPDLFEHHVEGHAINSIDESNYNRNLSEYREQLQKDRKYWKEILSKKMDILRAPCTLDKKRCRQQKLLLREEIKQTRIRLGKLRAELRRTRKSKRRKFHNADGHFSDNMKNESYDSYEPAANITNLEQTDGTDAEYVAKSRQRRAATSKSEALWDYGVIPFMIEANFTGRIKALFKDAMRRWERETCIIFKDKEPDDRNYILFTVRPCGCCSHIGKKGSGGQAISIGEDCDKLGIVIHELGHAIGFGHEHNRPDRDEYVEIITAHIEKNQEYNFNKFEESEINSLGEPYDYASIMHYSRNKFSKNNNLYLDTIKPHLLPNTAVRPHIGQRVRLSPGDVRQTNKLYQCPSCGKTLFESTDKFSHTPTEGTPEMCQWRISVAHGETIALNITRLEMPMADNCEHEYLEVRDGHYLLSPLLGRFCGDEVPVTLTSTRPRMWLEYKTLNGGGKGFDAIYEAVCGGEIIKENGFLESPGFPGGYSANKECEWIITVNEGFTVALRFDNFELEHDDECDYDYLEIRDGQDETSRLIGKGRYCGDKMPEDIQSTGRHLYVKFLSDAWGQKAGFSASFLQEYDECLGDSSGCEHSCVNTIGSYRCTCRIGYELHSDGKRCNKACGGHIDGIRGTITSPSFPDLYPPDKTCLWRIVAPDDKNIKIRFRHFDLEGARRGCPYDTLRISSGTGSNVEQHGVYCGYKTPGLIVSKGNVLILEFSSDSTVQKTGFKATYRMGKYKLGRRRVRKGLLSSSPALRFRE